MLERFMSFYTELLHFIAEFTVHTLEIIGISIIIFGSARVLIQAAKRYKNREKAPKNVIIELGRSLALALEFKMGAEIVNTVIIKDLRELVILAIIIALRALLALLIHWEIKNEKAEEEMNNEKNNKEE